MSVFQDSQRRVASPARTEQDDDDVTERDGARAQASYGGARLTRDATARVRVGRGPVMPDPRKYKYDVMRGRAAKVPFAVSRDDRMSAAEAGAALDAVHRMFGIDRENEDFLSAFDTAMFFCHTVNGGSTLQPGRSVFSVVKAGNPVDFDMAKIRDKLGVDIRRFFRAFADDVAAVNRQVLAAYDPYDPVSAEQWGWLMQVAHSRGLQRYPHLAHDSADACTTLTTAERAALASSKVSVIGTTNNSADRARANDRVISADGYDSTVGNMSV